MANSKISALTSATTPLAGTETLPIVQSGATKQVAVSDLTAGRAVSFSGFTMTGGTGNSVVYLNGAAVATTGSGLTFNGTKLATTGYFNTTGMGIFQGPLSTFDAASGGLYNYYSGGGVIASYSNNSGTLSPLSFDGSTIQLRTGNANRLVVGASDVTVSTGNLVQGTAAKGVNFTANTPAAGMTSQLLNWYEEGTWTPTIAAGTGSITSYTTTNCTYTRVGRLVTLFGSFTITNNGTGSGNIAISNLPYSVKDTYSAGGVARENALTGTMCNITIDGSTTTLVMRTYSNGYPGATGASFKFSASYIV
jgi:hypothetical protein